MTDSLHCSDGWSCRWPHFYLVLPFRFAWHTCWWAEGGSGRKVWAARHLNPPTEEMCPFAFQSATHFCPLPVLPLVSVDGGATPISANPAELCAALDSTFTQRDSSQPHYTCSQIERWLCHSQGKLWCTLPSFFVDPTSILLPNAGWEESYHCPLEE